MSVHVCKCINNGHEEFHIRYPGWSEEEAQDLADRINSGLLRQWPEEATDLAKAIHVARGGDASIPFRKW